MLILKNLHHSRAGQGKYVCSLRWVSVQGRVSDGAWSEYTLGSMGEVRYLWMLPKVPKVAWSGGVHFRDPIQAMLQ